MLNLINIDMILRNYVLLLICQSFQIAISWPVDSITSHQEDRFSFLSFFKVLKLSTHYFVVEHRVHI